MVHVRAKDQGGDMPTQLRRPARIVYINWVSGGYRIEKKTFRGLINVLFDVLIL